MSYDNDNKGAIWKNEKREKDTHPHFTGSATIAGVEYWVSAWKRGEDAPDKAPALKFSFKPKEERKPTDNRRAQPPVRQSRDADADGFDDSSIPF